MYNTKCKLNLVDSGPVTTQAVGSFHAALYMVQNNRAARDYQDLM